MWAKLRKFAESLVKTGPLIVGILGIWLGLLTFSFNKSNKERDNQNAAQQAQQTKQAEETRARIDQAQANLQQSQFAASLIPFLVKGSDKEKELALDLVCGVDKSLCTRISATLSQSDPNPSFREYAIEGLAKRGDPSARPTLLAIQQQGQTPTEREDAKRGVEILTDKLKATLSRARAFYDAERWRDAAYYFYEASKFVSSAEVNPADLALARSDYEHGGYQEAARSFHSLFSKF